VGSECVGKSIVENLSEILKSEFPNMRGFSRRNLFYSESNFIVFINQILKKCKTCCTNSVGT